MDTSERERRRRDFKPDPVRLLFIGESPPRNERTFFYFGAGDLYDHTVKAFERSYGGRCDDAKSFLDFFRDCGCYLEDLSQEPINQYRGQQRRERREQAVPVLARRIIGEQPDALIIVGRKICEYVIDAINQANLPRTRTWCLYFPGQRNEWKRRYVEALAAAVGSLSKDGILPEALSGP